MIHYLMSSKGGLYVVGEHVNMFVPELVQRFYPAVATARDAEKVGVLGRTVYWDKVARAFYVRHQNHIHPIYIKLRGDGHPSKVRRVPIPKPYDENPNRQYRWRLGRWEKFIQRRGWVAA